MYLNMPDCWHALINSSARFYGFFLTPCHFEGIDSAVTLVTVQGAGKLGLVSWKLMDIFFDDVPKRVLLQIQQSSSKCRVLFYHGWY
jgi:hypothetical protein